MELRVEPQDIPQLLGMFDAVKGKPDMSDTVVAAWFAVCQRHDVTIEEFREAAVRHLSRAEFFPAPAQMVTHVRQIRMDKRKLQERAVQEADRQEAHKRAELAEADAEPSAPPEGYPWRKGPPIDKTPLGARSRIQYPVRGEDGKPDPYWPEIPGRGPAWRRKLLYDAGLASWEHCSALTMADAKKAPSKLDAPDNRGGGIRRLI